MANAPCDLDRTHSAARSNASNSSAVALRGVVAWSDRQERALDRLRNVLFLRSPSDQRVSGKPSDLTRSDTASGEIGFRVQPKRLPRGAVITSCQRCRH